MYLYNYVLKCKTVNIVHPVIEYCFKISSKICFTFWFVKLRFYGCCHPDHKVPNFIKLIFELCKTTTINEYGNGTT